MENQAIWHKSIELLHNQQLEESFGASGSDKLKQKLSEKSLTPKGQRKLIKSRSQNCLNDQDLFLDLNNDNYQQHKKSLETAISLHQYIYKKMTETKIHRNEADHSVINAKYTDTESVLKDIWKQVDLLFNDYQNLNFEVLQRRKELETQVQFEVISGIIEEKDKVLEYLDLDDQCDDMRYVKQGVVLPSVVNEEESHKRIQEQENLILELEKEAQRLNKKSDDNHDQSSFYQGNVGDENSGKEKSLLNLIIPHDYPVNSDRIDYKQRRDSFKELIGQYQNEIQELKSEIEKREFNQAETQVHITDLESRNYELSRRNGMLEMEFKKQSDCFQEAIGQYQNEIQSLKLEIQKLDVDKADIQGLIKDLESQNDELRGRNLMLDTQNQNEIQALKIEIQNMEADKANIQDQIKDWQSKNDELLSRNYQLEQNLKEANANFIQQINASDLQNKELGGEGVKSGSCISLPQDDVASTKFVDIKDTHDSVQEFQNELQNLRIEIRESKVEKDNIQDQLKNLESQNYELRRTNLMLDTQNQNEIQALRTELQKYKIDYASIQDHIKDLESKNDELVRTSAMLDMQYNNEIQALNFEIQKYVGAQNDLQDHISNLESQNDELRSRNAMLDTELEKQNNSFDHDQKEIQVLKSGIQKLEIERADIQVLMKDLESQIDELRISNAQLKDNLMEANTQINVEKSKNFTMGNQIEDLKGRNEQLEKESEDLNSIRTENGAALAKLQKELSCQKADTNQIMANLRLAEREMLQLKSDVQLYNDSIDNLQEHLLQVIVENLAKITMLEAELDINFEENSKEIQNLKLKNELQVAQILDLVFKLSETESENDFLKNNNSGSSSAVIDTQIKDLALKNSILEAEKHELESLLLNERTMLNQLQREAAETSQNLELNNNSLAEKLRELQKSKENLSIISKMEANQLSYENESLMKALNDLRDEMEDLHQASSKMKLLYDQSLSHSNNLSAMLEQLKVEREKVDHKICKIIESDGINNTTSQLFSILASQAASELINIEQKNEILSDVLSFTRQEAQESCQKFNETIGNLQVNVAKLEKENFELSSKLADLEYENCALNNHLLTSQGAASQYKAKIDELAKNIENMSSQKEELLKKIAIIQMDSDNAAREAIERTSEKVLALSLNLAEVEKERDELIIQKNVIQKQSQVTVNDLSLKIEKLLSRIDTLEEEASSQKPVDSDLLSKFNSLEQENLKLLQENLETKNNCSEFATLNERLFTKLQEMEEQKDELSNRLTEMEVNAERAIENNLAYFSSQISEFEMKISKLEGEKIQLNVSLDESNTLAKKIQNDLIAKIDNLSKNIEKLEIEKQELSNALKDQNVAANIELQALSAQILELHSKIDGLEVEKTKLEHDILDLSDKGKRMEVEFSAITEELSQKVKRGEKEKEDLSTIIESMKSDSIAISAQIPEFRTKITILEEERNKLENYLKISDDEYKRMKDELSANIAALSETLHCLEKDKNDLVQENESVRIELQKKSDAFETSALKINDLLLKIRSLEEGNEEIKKIELDKEVALKRNAEMISRIQSLERDNMDLLQKIQIFETENLTLLEDIKGYKSVETLNGEYLLQLTALEHKIEDLERQRMDALKELNEYKTDLINAKRESSAVLQESSEMLHKMKLENDSLRQLLEESKAELNGFKYEYESKIESLNNEKVELISALESSKSKSDSTAVEISEYNAKILLLSEQVKAVQQENDSLVGQISVLSAQVGKRKSSDLVIPYVSINDIPKLEISELVNELESNPKIPFSDDPDKLQKVLVINGKPVLKLSTLPWYLAYLLEIQSSDSFLVYSFLLHHPIFTESKTLLGMILLKWVEIIKDKNPVHFVYMTRMANILKIWIKSFENDIRMNETRVKYIVSIIFSQPEEIKANEANRELIDLITKKVQDSQTSAASSRGSINRKTSKRMSSKTVSNTTPASKRISSMMSSSWDQTKNRNLNMEMVIEEETSDKVILFMDLDPSEVAQQITILDFKYFKLIEPREFIDSNWTKKEKLELSPNICKLAQWTSNATVWIASEILLSNDLNERTNILAHVIQLGYEFVKIKNFNGLKMIMNALSLKPIYRLKQTFQNLKSDARNKLEDLKALIDEQNNFVEIRKISKSTNEPLIPYPGAYHRDLLSLATLGDIVSTENDIQWINADRINRTTAVINSILEHQKPEYEYQLSTDFTDYLLKRQKLSAEEMEKASLSLEPNQSAE